MGCDVLETAPGAISGLSQRLKPLVLELPFKTRGGRSFGMVSNSPRPIPSDTATNQRRSASKVVEFMMDRVQVSEMSNLSSMVCTRCILAGSIAVPQPCPPGQYQVSSGASWPVTLYMCALVEYAFTCSTCCWFCTAAIC